MTVTDEEFLALSAVLTGFTAAELAATGMAGEYRELTVRRLGESGLRELLPGTAGAEAAQAVAHLWYLGSWPPPPGEAAAPVSARAYAQALVWRTFGGRPPATDAPGAGSWAVLR
ncbi:hypothetical protein ACFYNO_37165 [Kitasatospora sp. NPDC006697]|uniref:hypothetical protein n=1 Tax=Kitasatospora sp. NPDC006697 TaxID=3364020 RepID=UPI00369EFB87